MSSKTGELMASDEIEKFEYEDLRGELDRQLIGFLKHNEHDEVVTNLYRMITDICTFAYQSGYTQGRSDALKELEQLQREAFESGHKAKVREEYNSALIKNGFVSAAGRYKDVGEAFNDYLSSKSKGGK